MVTEAWPTPWEDPRAEPHSFCMYAWFNCKVVLAVPKGSFCIEVGGLWSERPVAWEAAGLPWSPDAASAGSYYVRSSRVSVGEGPAERSSCSGCAGASG
jgi:hypothetical protein